MSTVTTTTLRVDAEQYAPRVIVRLLPLDDMPIDSGYNVLRCADTYEVTEMSVTCWTAVSDHNGTETGAEPNIEGVKLRKDMTRSTRYHGTTYLWGPMETIAIIPWEAPS